MKKMRSPLKKKKRIFGACIMTFLVAFFYALKGQGATSYIVDLRENSGGYMDQAIKMANEFLSKGDMIVYSEGRAYPRYEARANGSGRFQREKLVVLIDNFSASASEIFAGAMQDNDRATIIGRRSFGKGLVQQQIPFADGSAIRLTVARYYTPSGRSIQKPYKMGEGEDYAMDLLNRFEHGEFYSADSVQIADSTVYLTKKGRIVRGGGGIMPDVFVGRAHELMLKVFHVVVLVVEELREGKAASVHDGCVVAVIADDVVVTTCQTGYDTRVDCETCGDGRPYLSEFQE